MPLQAFRLPDMTSLPPLSGGGMTILFTVIYTRHHKASELLWSFGNVSRGCTRDILSRQFHN